MNNRKVGDLYELKTCEYFESIGYKILQKNFRGKRGEIDVIAKDGDTIVFTEVKYRTTNALGYPEEAVSPTKQNTILGVANYFLLRYGLTNVKCRFDVVAHYSDGSFKHYKNAFGGM